MRLIIDDHVMWFDRHVVEKWCYEVVWNTVHWKETTSDIPDVFSSRRVKR